MAFPPAHLLVGAGAAELARLPTPLPFWKVWVVGAFFGVLPDLDTGILLLLGEKAPYHGLYTHNLVAVALVGIAVWSLAGRHWALIAGTAYTSHLVVDLLRQGSTSVHLWWPLSSEPMRGLARVFPVIPFDWHFRRFEPGGADPIEKLIEQTLIGAAFFAIAVLLVAVLRTPPISGKPQQAYTPLPPKRRRRSRRR